MRSTLLCAVAVAAAAVAGFEASAQGPDQAAGLYRIKCAACHGRHGSGDTAMGAKLGVKDYHSPEAAKMSDDEFLEIIKEGRHKMLAYDKKLTEDQIKGLVKYIRSLPDDWARGQWTGEIEEQGQKISVTLIVNSLNLGDQGVALRYGAPRTCAVYGKYVGKNNNQLAFSLMPGNGGFCGKLSHGDLALEKTEANALSCTVTAQGGTTSEGVKLNRASGQPPKLSGGSPASR